MPYAEPEKRKEYQKEYRKKNKEIISVKRHEKYEKNKEVIKENVKEYYIKNKEKLTQYKKDYRKTETGKKLTTISSWKQRGIVTHDWEGLYKRYTDARNCEDCGCELIEGKGLGNHKHLDHDHTTGLVRNILCGKCNINKK